MRGVKAKRIRRAVYGEQSLKQARRYRRTDGGTLVNVGPRGVYRRAKYAVQHRLDA